jgi:hypothetical protein
MKGRIDMYNHALRGLGLAAVLALAACATGNPKATGGSASDAAAPVATPSMDVPPPPPFPEGVEERAQVRWDLLVARRADRAWDLLSPGARAAQKREEYAALFSHRPVTWLSAKVDSKKCDADSCTLKVEVRYKAEIPQSSAGPIESTAYLEERWIRVDGAWYLVPEKASGG